MGHLWAENYRAKASGLPGFWFNLLDGIIIIIIYIYLCVCVLPHESRSEENMGVGSLLPCES